MVLNKAHVEPEAQLNQRKLGPGSVKLKQLSQNTELRVRRGYGKQGAAHVTSSKTAADAYLARISDACLYPFANETNAWSANI